MKGSPLGSSLRRRAGAGAVVAAAALACAASASADTLVVTTTASDGAGSFRDAADRADSDGDVDKITFAPGLEGTINLSHRLRFKNPVEIIGNDYGRTRSDSFKQVKLEGPKHGAQLRFESRVQNAVIKEMYLERVPLYGSVTAIDMIDSFTQGSGSVRAPADWGYYSDREFKVENTTVTGYGSGIRAQQDTVNISDSRISGNTGPGVVSTEYAAFHIVDSTITGNRGVGAEAGYEAFGTIDNSTISDNRSNGYAGGVAGHVEVNDSTITGNRGRKSGGVFGTRFDPLRITNSIVAGNFTKDGPSDCGDSVNSRGGNLIENPDCTTRKTDLTGVDPRLGPLAANGGLTRTYALRKGSPAIGLALPTTSRKRDQRGVHRDKHPDAGSYER